MLRDWAWESVENDSRFECVREVLPERKAFKAGKLLTLGAGACRLAYDLHLRYAPELSVALDVNPLPLLLAARVLSRETIALHEFPVAPLSQSMAAIARLCAAPAPLDADGAPFVLVLADALHAPFKAGSFDTVLTPWLLDIVPQSLTDWVRTVNRLLAKGGTWINTGPLAFRHRNEAWCYGEEEVLELVGANGFVIGASGRKEVPYLQSPASGRGRIERAVTFSATKVADAAAPERLERHPPWLVDTTRAVPDLDELCSLRRSGYCRRRSWPRSTASAASSRSRSSSRSAMDCRRARPRERCGACCAKCRRDPLDEGRRTEAFE